MNKEQKVFTKSYENHIVDLKNINEVEVISTGNLHLDQALVCGGIPKGRITEIYGNESSGKSTLALEIIKECQRKKGRVLFLDLEGSIEPKYLRNLGIDLNSMLVAQPTSGELTFQMIEDALNDELFDLIVVDSVAAMLSINEQEAKFQDPNHLGAHARMMSRGLRKIQSLLYKAKTAIVFINQIREKIGVYFGNPETTTGGRALRFFSSLRLEVKKVDLLKNGNDKIGIKSKITITKNKLGKPYNFAFINIYFETGFDYTKDIIEFAIAKEIITRKGPWFYFQEHRLGQGMNNVLHFFKENSEILKQIETKVASINTMINDPVDDNLANE